MTVNMENIYKNKYKNTMRYDRSMREKKQKAVKIKRIQCNNQFPVVS